MDTQNAFKDLMHKVLTEHAPEQLDNFDFEADERIAELFHPSEVPVVAGHEAAYGAGIPSLILANLEPAMKYLGLIAATFKTLKEVYTWWKEQQAKDDSALSDHLRTAWLKDLQKAGVEQAQATQIVNSFLKDATTLAKNFKPTKP